MKIDSIDPAAVLRRRGLRRTALMAAACALGACDIPTEAPIFETRFVIPGEPTSLGVTELLPGSLAEVDNTFRLTLGPATIPGRTLGQMCGAPCTALPPGTTAPKPAFTTTVVSTIDVPNDVVSATVTAATVTVALTHNFGFDPLQPSGRTQDGFLAITVRNGARVVGVDTLRGAFPSGSTLTRPITLATGEMIGDLDVTITLSSPAGGTAPQHWVPVNTAASFGGTVTPSLVTLSQTRITVNNKNVRVSDVELDLSDIDETVAERVQSGAIVLAINNPLGVVGTMTLTISGGSAGPIAKQLQMGTGTTTRRIEFTGAELQSMLGSEITLSITGPVSAPNGTITLTPGQRILIDSKLDLILEIGG